MFRVLTLFCPWDNVEKSFFSQPTFGVASVQLTVMRFLTVFVCVFLFFFLTFFLNSKATNFGLTFK